MTTYKYILLCHYLEKNQPSQNSILYRYIYPIIKVLFPPPFSLSNKVINFISEKYVLRQKQFQELSNTTTSCRASFHELLITTNIR